MSDLPVDRLTVAPPFTFIGVDTFGPWAVVSRRTRGGSASCKRWAVLFTCLTTRAIHIEVVEEMSASSFINAFRRFLSIRGPVKEIRSDKGTNFIGSTENLQIDAINVEDGAGGTGTFKPYRPVDLKDLYKAQWKRAQAMADLFWSRWRHEYLFTLQSRRKWQTDSPNIKQNDVVLLKDKDQHRNEWPLCVIVNAFPGSDSRVRKATVRLSKLGNTTIYTRPISEMVLLVSGK